MTVKIEVSDLGSTSKGDLVKLAKFMLEFAGYSEPAPVVAPPAPVVAAPVQHVWPEDVAPTAAFAAPVVAPPVANVAPVPPAPQAPGIEVDAQGFPWDQRIHSGSRGKNTDGSWRQKRNLDPNLLAQVESELRATMGLPGPAQTVDMELTTTTEVVASTPEQAFIDAVIPPPPFVPSAVVPAAPVAIAPPLPSTPAGAVTTASPSSQSGTGVAVVTFPALMQKITQAFTAKTLDQATIQAACQQVGLPSLPMLASRPDLVGQVATILGIAL